MMFLSLVLLRAAMFLPAELAEGGGFGVVHAVFDGLECSQVSKDRLQIVISHVSVLAVGHDRLQFAGART